MAVSPNSPAVTFNEGSKPGYSVPVREHSRACTHILPTNEALLRNPVLTPILFLFALPVTPRREVVQVVCQPEEKGCLAEVIFSRDYLPGVALSGLLNLTVVLRCLPLH